MLGGTALHMWHGSKSQTIIKDGHITNTYRCSDWVTKVTLQDHRILSFRPRIMVSNPKRL